jgi:hypothetical protein
VSGDLREMANPMLKTKDVHPIINKKHKESK